MSEEDRARWDRRHSEALPTSPGLPPVFAPFEHLFPGQGRALEIACGRGATAVSLATRGMEVLGVDVSPVAIDKARKLAETSEVSDRCRFEVVDLDGGLPDGPPVDLILCHMFRDPSLDAALIKRLAPGGLLAVAAQSEVGAGPGRFRARPGELREAFGALEILAHGEEEGVAWIIGRRRLGPPH